MTTVDPSEKHYELDPLVTRVLKRGDLTRINSDKPGKLKDHHGDLARVVKSEAVGPTLENSHPFVYDLELVLGGKLHGVFRADLLYTTASQEGMTDDSRARRKRKPSSHYDDQEEEAKKAKIKAAAAGKKKKVPGKKGKVLVTPASKPATSKKRPAGDKAAKSSKKSKPVPVEETPLSTTSPASQAMDLFERHRREFERSLGRLEKADAYNFFGTAVPDEFQESYTRPKSRPTEAVDEPQNCLNDSSFNPPVAQHHGAISSSQSPPTDISMNEKKSKKTKKTRDGDEDDDDDDAVYFPRTPPFNFVVIRQRMERGRYILNRVRIENEERIELLTPYWKSIGRKNINRRPKKSQIPVLHTQAIDWDIFREDVHAMCDAAVDRNRHLDDVGPGTLGHAAAKIKDLMEHIYEKNGRRHLLELTAANHRHRFSLAMDQNKNTLAAMQGKWKRDAFPERKYERLRGDVVCAGLSELDQKIAAYELKTTLDDKFIGLAYKYDDTGQSEGWMKSVLDVTGEPNQRQEAAMALASDEGAIKAQVNASMQSLLIGVLDKVMTEKGVLQQKELRCANTESEISDLSGDARSDRENDAKLEPEFVVQEVWGIDCYTRRNVAICLETEFDSDTVQLFTEKWLLPAINACPVDLAHDISNACRMLEGVSFDLSTSLENEKGTTYEQWKSTILGKALLNKISSFGPPWLKGVAHLLRRARESMGPDFFRIHPKGHGSIVLCEKLEPNRLVTFYRGEVYPSWRWGEKIDAIAKIQEQKGLKPVLPDFFNMALERPQHDPRGYGLMFVDASRKSNYGSMLSHSCQPSCEVHVVAVNGELRLAITTIREMTIGDEMTFDYNAVTESLFEYQSAVCLCGHSRCSGSFLHFAAADCYQQVLNRNSPVASRLANLIKGCTKKVTAEEDERILKRHGFQTAAFGAVSVNRRNACALNKLDSTLDSMNIVPVWLRTFVADTLRYIEYERRALPIALICNDIYDETGSAPVPTADEQSNADNDSAADEPMSDEDSAEEAEKTGKRSKPEPTFFFFARTQRDYFVSLLADDVDKQFLTGAEQKRETQKLASAHWKSLDAAAKDMWKAKAYEEWEKNGWKAIADVDKKKKRRKSVKKDDGNGLETKTTEDIPKRPKISFQEADAEGVSAMEQRIQQLTQTLSRVGRVLDRHRESALRSNNGSNLDISDETLREITHSPLMVLPDEHVVAWMWNHPDGIVRSLLSFTEKEVCVSPELRKAIVDTVEKHSVLANFGRPWTYKEPIASYPMSPSEGRDRLNEALLELRKDLLDGIQQMATVIKKQKAKCRAMTRRTEREEQESPRKDYNHDLRSTLQSLMDDMVRTIEERSGSATWEIYENCSDSHSETKVVVPDPEEDLDPWLRNFNKRFKIEKAADLLLMYAKTGYFFSIKGYKPLKSSPIEVYARDLGNAVPASTIDPELVREPDSTVSSPQHSPLPAEHLGGIEDAQMDVSENGAVVSKKPRKLCDPEDIISNVVVEYQGDYVLAQLLQWYNAGIGQKPGLPNVLGCILLPSMKGCWSVDGTTVSNSFTDRATRYHSMTRRRLIDWLKDPLKRGNPWPDEVRRAFVDKEEDGMVSDASAKWLPIGSPILDFLVTGDDHNMNAVLSVLSSFHSSTSKMDSSVGEGLLSSVDEGRPAEATSNWVQCENPECQKWRKVPWHIDINMLPDQFFCKDNFWNLKSASCDAPEDEWDQTTDAQVGVDGSAMLLESALDTTRKRATESTASFKLCDFRIGAQFDIQRAGKKIWAVGTVTNSDLAGDVKRIKVHYQNKSFKHDEWIEVDSPRIAPLYSNVQRPTKKENVDDGNRKRESELSKAKKEKNSKKQKKLKKKPYRTNEIFDDTSLERADESHVVHTDDSSMADVFLQDSDDDDEPPVRKSANKPSIQAKVNRLDDPEEDGTFDESTKDEPRNETKESDNEGDQTLRKSNPAAVTDESSPEAGEARKNAEGESPAKSFTIPKKKKSTVPKQSLLAAGIQKEDDVAQQRKEAQNANRIPRKKSSFQDKPTTSLLSQAPAQLSSPSGQDEKRSSNSRGNNPRSLPVEQNTFSPKKESCERTSRRPWSNGRDVSRPDTSRSVGNANVDTGGYNGSGRDEDRVESFRSQPRNLDSRPTPRFDRSRHPELEYPSPSNHTRRDFDDVYAMDRQRTEYRKMDSNPTPQRNNRIQDGADHFSRDHALYDGYNDVDPSFADRPPHKSPGRNPRLNGSNRAEGHGRSPRASYSGVYSHRSEGALDDVFEDRHRQAYSGFGRDNDERVYDRSYERAVDDWPEERRGRRWNQDFRHRSGEDYSRSYDYTPDKAYDRQLDRFDPRYDDYDGDYNYRGRYDHPDGYGYDRYSESPRRKHRSRDRSRERSRDSGKRYRDPSSRHKHRHSEERHAQEKNVGNIHLEPGEQLEYEEPTGRVAEATYRANDTSRARKETYEYDTSTVARRAHIPVNGTYHHRHHG